METTTKNILIILLSGLLAIVFLSGGGLQASYTPTPIASDSMECYNYEITLTQMDYLQTQHTRSWLPFVRKGRENKINALRPSLINREVLCLGYGVTPN